MKLEKAIKRDRDVNKRRSGHKVDGRSVFKIQEIQKERAIKIKRNVKQLAQEASINDSLNL